MSSMLNNVRAGKYIPEYTYHVDESVVYVRDGKVFGTFEINGFPFESVNDSEIINLHDTLRNFLIVMCKTQKVYMWSHMVKKKDTLENTYHAKDNDFLQGFYEKYIESISDNNFFQTKFYLTFGIDVNEKKSRDGVDAAIDSMNEVLMQARSVLKTFNIRSLGVKDNGCSEIAEYLSYLVNHKPADLPLTSTKISETIASSDQFFGFDAFQLQNHEDEGVIFGVNYVLKDFPRQTEIGHFDFLLRLPYEFVLTHSFVPIAATKAIKELDQQLNKLRSTRNYSELDEFEMLAGGQAIQAGESMLGSFHSVISVFGDTFEEAKENGVKVTSEFLSSGKGFRYTKATFDSAISLFSHLPLSKNRPLDTTRSIGNFACLNSFHNFSYGKPVGNPIGDGTAILPLKTSSDSLYYFNSHASELGKNMLGQKVAGHALILGATGTGKTTFEATACAFVQRFNPQMFVVDYNRSTELFVRAFGGVYFDIQEGVSTGINPFQLGNNDDPELISFLKSWVKRCALFSDGKPPTDEEAGIIDSAVDSVMAMPVNLRRFGTLLQSIDPKTPLGERLSKWVGDGAYSWALDSPKNIFNPKDADIVGFDTTVILESVNGNDHPACEAILSVLFFYKNRMQKSGKTMLSIVEEFWKPANFPMTQDMIKSALKAGRMKGEMMWLTSQSPQDAINCDIFHAIVQQTSTKICLPNPDAEYDGYRQIGLTEKEFKILKGLGRESRTMLVKQSGSSVFAKLDLYGFDDYLPILSGTKEGIAIAKGIIDEVGTEPNDWIPIFLERINQKKNDD